MSETENQSNRQLARAAGTVMLAMLFGQIAGLVSKILIGQTFNASDVDAFLAANRPSEALVFVMTGGIFVSSFIPVFVKFLVKEDRQEAWKLASATANLILIIMTMAGALLAIFASPVVKYVLAAGFSPDKQILTVNLLRIQAISILFFSMSGLLIGILNSHKKFLLSALAPSMYQFGQMFGTLFLAPRMGIYGLAWGVVLGSVLNLLIQVPGLLQLKGRYHPTLGLHNHAVGEVIRLMGPRMFGAAVVQLMLVINTLLASENEGAVYALSYGFSLMIMAQVAIAQSAGTAVLPTFSAQYAQGKLDELKKTLASVLRAEFLLSLPATAGLIFLSTPIIAFLYQRGEFTADTTRMVAWALVWYAAGLVFHSVLEVLVRAYYAMHDTKTPVLVGAAAMLLSIGLSLLFSTLFKSIGWMPHGGLALAVSVSTALEVTTLFLFMRKRLGGIHDRDLAVGFGSAALGTLGMAAALWGWLAVTGSAPSVVIAMGGVAIGGVVYGLTLAMLRVPEVGQLLKAGTRLIRRITRSSKI